MNTKSIISVALATALLGVAACGSDDGKDLLVDVADSNAPHLVTFNVYTEGAVSSLQKLQYNDAQDLVWEGGEKVKMATNAGVLQDPFTVTRVVDGYDYFQISGMATGNGPYYALYPYQAEAEGGENIFKNVEIPSVQTVKAGQFDPKADIMVAESDGDMNLYFRHVCAKLGIKVPVDNVAKIVISSMDVIAGFVNIATSEAGITDLPDDPSYSITLNCAGGFEKGKTYYACLLPLYSPELTIYFYDADGKLLSYVCPKLDADIARNDRIKVDPPANAVHDNVSVTLDDLRLFYYVPNTATKVVFDNKSKVDVSSMERIALLDHNQVGIYVNNGTEYYILSENDFEICMKGSLSEMFLGFGDMEVLELNNFNTANVTDMQSMFENCSGLTTLTFGDNFNTANVTNMGNMFRYCSGLTNLTFGDNFKTANVTDMQYMFYGCFGLTNLTFGDNFKTSSVRNMTSMFAHCYALTSLDLDDNFNTSNVTYMNNMFGSCTALKTIYATNKFTTDKVTESSNMFYGSTSLVGGMGTKYDSQKKDATYARIDGGASAPGYFTPKGVNLSVDPENKVDVSSWK